MTDLGGDTCSPIVAGVGHVETKDVRAGVNETGDGLKSIGGGAKGGDDFGTARDHSMLLFQNGGEATMPGGCSHCWAALLFWQWPGGCSSDVRQPNGL